MTLKRIGCVVLLPLTIVGCSSGNPSLFGGASPNVNCYDTTYVRTHFAIGRSTTGDVLSACGDTKTKSMSSSGTESWSYRESDQYAGYDPVHSLLVKGFDKVQGVVMSNNTLGQVNSEISKANDGNNNSTTAADAMTGKNRDGHRYTSFYFKNGVMTNYSISQ